MPGRPKRMAARLSELEERAYQVSVDVGTLCPGAYKEWKSGWDEDDYGAVWCRAAAATKAAARSMNYVLGLAEVRAFGEDVADDMDCARDVKRGQWPPGVEVPERIKAQLNSALPSD